jgi:hypothetical protein
LSDYTTVVQSKLYSKDPYCVLLYETVITVNSDPKHPRIVDHDTTLLVEMLSRYQTTVIHLKNNRINLGTKICIQSYLPPKDHPIFIRTNVAIIVVTYFWYI